ncbi:MAG: hypothetical protein IJF94_02785 [Eubacterium sp.]|nr:hypothetical protein [Eubacterium sp.]
MNKDYLNELNKYGSKLGLDSINELLERLDNPQYELRVVHFAGTNGKGSTMNYLQSILLKAGYSVGTFASPAVFDDNEFIKVDGVNISDDDLDKYSSLVEDACQAMVKQGKDHPTRFEVETAIALCFFKDANLDICLIECGMGGKEDATNVFSWKLASVITRIGLDHREYLGDNLEEITRNKFGIVTDASPVVIGRQQPEVRELLEQLTEEKEVELYDSLEIDTDTYVNHRFTSYQEENIQTAIRTALVLQGKGFELEPYIEDGIESAKWPGRLEMIMNEPMFLIDGAHNPDGVRALKELLDNNFTNTTFTFIMGVLADKDYEKECEIITPMAKKVFTTTPRNARALDGQKLAEVVSKYNENVTFVPEVDDIAGEALKYAKANGADMIVAFGTLSYLKDLKAAALKF